MPLKSATPPDRGHLLLPCNATRSRVGVPDESRRHSTGMADEGARRVHSKEPGGKRPWAPGDGGDWFGITDERTHMLLLRKGKCLKWRRKEKERDGGEKERGVGVNRLVLERREDQVPRWQVAVPHGYRQRCCRFRWPR